MQRIGIDVRLTAYRTGGIASYTESLTQSLAPVLAARSWDMFLYTARRHDTDGSPARSGHQAILWTPPHHRLEQVTLPMELVRTRPTLFHSPDFIPPRYWPGRAVITVHDLDFVLTPERLTEESRRYYSQIRWAVHRAEAIIAVSEATRADLVRLVGADAGYIAVIPEAADAIYTPSCVPEVMPQYFLFVGTIEPRKNIDTLLDAYLLYREHARSPAPLVVTGGEGWQSAATVRRLRGTPGVTWRGPASRDELLPLYRGALALVLPSWYEGFGLPVVEAMACGVPAIVSDTPALREVAGDAALVAPPDDPGAWAALLRTLAERPDVRFDYRGRGIARAAQFSWAKAAVATADLYARVLAAPRRQTRKERGWRRTR
jgi:glycosyltransferase involved in cell wall biosynthesis